METPIRRRRSDRRRPDQFHETLTPTMPAGAMSWHPPKVLDRARITRYGLYAIWILATIAAGAGVGLAIVSSQSAVTTSVPAVPVATASVAVKPLPTPQLLAGPAVIPSARLAVASSDSVYQSELGDIWHVMTTNVGQPAASPLELQPGFTGYGFGQGGNGTDPVR